MCRQRWDLRPLRVNWELYMFEVMEAMNSNQELISLVKTIYAGLTLHFKVRYGVIDKTSTSTQNGNCNWDRKRLPSKPMLIPTMQYT